MSLCVKDVMSREVKSVSLDMNAKEAVKLLIERGSSGLAVIDRQGTLVGVFTEREILNAILPVYVQKVGTFVYGEDSKGGLKKMANLENFLVKDLLRSEVPVVSEDASLAEVSRIMLTKSERRVMVVKDKKVIGVITRCDVVKALAREAGIVS